MIRLFLYFIAALTAGSLIAVWMGDDPGLVLINFRGYAIETSLLSLFVLLLVLFALFYVLAWLFSRLNPFLIVRNRGGFFLSRGQAARGTEEGFVALTEERYLDAYKKLVANARRSATPLVNYLGAAQAAFKLDDPQGIRFCLREAVKYSPEATVADGLLTARLEEENGQTEEASRRLRALHIRHDTHPGIVRQLAEYYVRLGAWNELVTLLPRIRALKAMPEAEYQAMESQAWRECMQQFDASSGRIPELEALWERVPSHLQTQEATVGTFIQKLTELGAYDRAQAMLFRHFRKHHSDNLLQMLGYLDTTRPGKLLGFVEKLNREHPDTAMLLLTLGRVSLRNRLWGKGRDHFEHALRLSTSSRLSAEISAELARLYEALGEHRRSTECYHRALGLLERKLPQLPLPTDQQITA